MPEPLKKIVILGPESTGKSTLCSQLAAHYNTFWCPEFARQYLLGHGTDYSFEDLLTIAKGQLALEESFIEQLVVSREGQVGKGGTNQTKTPDTQVLGNICHSALAAPFSPVTAQHLPLSIPHSLLATAHSPLTTPYFLFLDTDMYVMKVWCEFVFGQCHPFILDQIADRRYDLYLLCNPDLPWVKDELREYPDLEIREKLYHIYRDLLINQSVPWVEIKGGYDQRLANAIASVEAI
ncbi:MAG: ATP-binding protein [Chitinophagaceae bacterium]